MKFNCCIITYRLIHLEDSTHIAVMHKGKFYRFGCYSNGQLLNPAELQM